MKTPKVDSFRFGKIVIDGVSHTRDVIILPDRVIGNWWRKSGHTLLEEDLQEIFKKSPEIVIVGLGTISRMKIPAETRCAIESAGIKLIALSSKQAWVQYNQLSEDKKVAAAIHLTC
ncbi:MTH938/NDUFAF3 family protein [Chloroflexota bacterium]